MESKMSIGAIMAVGLPEGFSVEGSESLGMQLIQALTNQLDGKLDVTNSSTGAPVRHRISITRAFCKKRPLFDPKTTTHSLKTRTTMTHKEPKEEQVMSQLKIMIVEDELIVAKDIQRILKKLGYEAFEPFAQGRKRWMQ
jgi:hypothetical protein